MRLTWLADILRAADLIVVEYEGWETRSGPGGHYDDSRFAPVGIVNHHTAGYYYLQHYPEGHWPDSSLDDKCNITIRPNGEVHVLNAGIAYDSGMGAPDVYEAVRNDQPLPHVAGLESTMNGTLHFIDIEVQHLGDGSPIEPAQREALIACNAAICERMGWNPRYRVIGHREWAPDRKVDPRWDGVANPMPGIRQDTIDLLEDIMPTSEEIAQAVWDHKERQFGDFYDQPPQRAGTLLAQTHANAWQAVKQTTREKLRAAAKYGASAAGGAIALEVGQRLIGGG